MPASTPCAAGPAAAHAGSLVAPPLPACWLCYMVAPACTRPHIYVTASHKRQRRHLAAKVREAAYKRQKPCACRVAREPPYGHLSISVMLHTDLPRHLPPTHTTTHKYCVYVCQHVSRTLTVAEHYVGGVVAVSQPSGGRVWREKAGVRCAMGQGWVPRCGRTRQRAGM